MVGEVPGRGCFLDVFLGKLVNVLVHKPHVLVVKKHVKSGMVNMRVDTRWIVPASNHAFYVDH